MPLPAGAFEDPIPAPPSPELRAVVVVPARLEAASIARCIAALAAQSGIEPSAYEVVVVLAGDDDETDRALKEACDRVPHLRVHVLHEESAGSGPARRVGMDAACARLLAVGRPDGLIATTDADSVVAPDWVAAQLDAVALGSKAIGGRIELSQDDLDRLPEAVAAWRRRRGELRHRKMIERAPPGAAVDHWQFSGASIGITAATYAEIGGLGDVSALEDEALERALERAGVPIDRLGSVRVTTSGRTDGRARRGLARDLELAGWFARRTFSASDYDATELAAAKREPVSVVLPAFNVAATIGRVLDELEPLRRAGLVDELLVVDGGSTDDTADIAAAAGVSCVYEGDLMPGYGPVRGKGDAMWRALSATTGAVIAFVDTDSVDFHAGYVVGLLGPLLSDPSISLVKGAFKRPLQLSREVLDDEGGRVTELAARPLINLHAPELAGFIQPLAGETAARRGLLEEIAFPVGYGVEMALLLDALRREGLWALAQVDLGIRKNRHQPLKQLGAMAYAVLVAAERRLHGEPHVAGAAPGPFILPTPGGLDVRSVPVEERPPMNAARRAPAG